MNHYRPSRHFLISFGTAILFVVTTIGCASKAQTPTPAEATPIRVEPVVESENALPILTVGALEPANSAKLSFKIGGPIAKLYVDEGDRVRQGQLLAVLATDEIDAAVRQTQAALDKAQRDADRMARLYRDSVVTLAQFQDSETALDVAAATHETTSFNRRYAQIVAPSAGRILHRHAEPGELVSPGSSILEIGFTARQLVRASLTDRDIVRVRTGDSATISFDAFPAQSFEGRVIRTGEAANQRTGSFDVEIAVLNPDKRLRSGFIARIEIAPSNSETLTIVHPQALVRAEGLSGTVFVFDQSSNTVREREIVIAGLGSEQIVVSRGLSAGELIVTEGAPYLTDGSRVIAIDQPPSSASEEMQQSVGDESSQIREDNS
ncbi:MAG: efflux RND transporter periplasmic adaptor subunit [Rhodothermales bacterium]|nr:efflux RND transporter periplasmic adaptor subunit [Rhodothermales bacterium]